MKLGEVLARNETNAKHLRNRSREGGRKRHLRNAFWGSWGTLFVCLMLIAVLDEEGPVEGIRALLLLFSLLGMVISFLVGLVVTGYIVCSWLIGGVKGAALPDGPQDTVAVAVLDSTSIFPLIALAFGWLFFVIVAGIIIGSVGFFMAQVVGFAVCVAATFFLGVLEQRVEVFPHEIRARTLGRRRRIQSALVSDIAFRPSSAENPQVAELVFRIDGDVPLRLRGNFVDDAERVTDFVADARQILRLDVPKDAVVRG